MADIQLLTDLKVIVIGDNHQWAKAETIEQARKDASNPKRYLAYVVHPDTTVDGIGSLNYPREFKPLLVSRGGKWTGISTTTKPECTHQGAVLRNRICSRCGQHVPRKEVQTQS